MKSEQLQTLVSVVEQGSFRAAARALHKTQPTVSATINALEREYGVRLLDRDSYRPRLTPEGSLFYREAKRLLKQVADFEEMGHSLAAGRAPRLSLSLSVMCVIPPELDKIKAFCARYPDLRLQISTEHKSGVGEQLLTGKAEIALGPFSSIDNSFEVFEIGRVPMITVATPAFIAAEGPLSQKTLKPKPQILISDTGSRPLYSYENIISGGVHWYVKDYQVKKTLLKAGMGWARIPHHMVKTELETGELVALEVENFRYREDVPIYMMRLRHLALSAIAAEFWQLMASRRGDAGSE